MTAEVTINGVTLRRPAVLDPDEVQELARFNHDRDRGATSTKSQRARMEQLQLRFDWLGYRTADGRVQPGPSAAPGRRRSSRRLRTGWWL